VPWVRWSRQAGFMPAADGSVRRWTFARGPDILTHSMVTTIAVGVDGSATAAEAVKMAAEVARRFEAELVLLSAYNRPDDDARQREVVARTETRLREEGLRCRALAEEGNPSDVLVRLAKQCGADILVVGNKGMQRRALGSVPNTVTHTADCSVLVVKTT
jgi:nucleotide-binding universal stress UspA family protein